MRNREPRSHGAQSYGVAFQNDTPRAVTLATFGMQSLHYPGSDPKPSFRYGTARNHDHSQAASSQVMIWKDIQTALGTYVYTGPDAWFNQNISDGTELIWCFTGTPDWAVTPAALGGAAYGGKSNMKPDSLSVMADHVTTMVNRYKDRCRIWQFGNEPNLSQYHHASSWTAADLAQMQRLCYQAAKAADPTCTVLSPPWTSVFSGISGLTAFLAASDGAAGTGKDWFDKLSYHFYCNDASNRPSGLIKMYRGALDAMSAVGISKPVVATETGLIVPYLNTYSAEEQDALVRSYLVTLLALGAERVCWYQEGNVQMELAASSIAVWNEVADACIGKTIVRSEIKVVSQIFLESTLWLSDNSVVSSIYGPMP